MAFNKRFLEPLFYSYATKLLKMQLAYAYACHQVKEDH